MVVRVCLCWLACLLWFFMLTLNWSFGFCLYYCVFIYGSRVKLGTCVIFPENKALDFFLATLYTSFMSVRDKRTNQKILKVKRAMRFYFLCQLPSTLGSAVWCLMPTGWCIVNMSRVNSVVLRLNFESLPDRRSFGGIWMTRKVLQFHRRPACYDKISANTADTVLKTSKFQSGNRVVKMVINT